MYQTSCYLCKSSSYKIIKKINSFYLYKCNNCGLVYIIVTKKEEFDININKYNNEYLSDYQKRQPILRKRFVTRIIEIERYKHGGRMLDVGCSTGIFLNLVNKFSKYKWDLYGIDINKKSLYYAKRETSAKLYCSTIQNINFQNEYFDCITCFDILEHDKLFVSTIKRIYQLLKKNGLLVIQSPNYRSVMAKLTGNNWDWWSVPDHVIHFCPSTLRKVLEENGFNIIYIHTWEPVQDFVGNIRGTLKKNLPELMNINKIVSKISIPFLYLLWFIIWLLEKKLLIGGLSLVYVKKR